MIVFHALIEPQPDGWLKATFPDLPGCHGRARSIEALQQSAEKAFHSGLIEALATPKGRRAPDAMTPRPRTVPGKSKEQWLSVEVGPREALRLQVRWAREDRKISQLDLAAKIGQGTQPRTISQLEGPESNPTLETLIRVVGALGMKLDIRLIDSEKEAP